MCTHTYSEAHTHSTYVKTDEGMADKVILLLYFFNLDSQEVWIFFLSKQCKTRWNAALCGISSGSALFAKTVSKMKRVKW